LKHEFRTAIAFGHRLRSWLLAIALVVASPLKQKMEDLNLIYLNKGSVFHSRLFD
jgi:hypothetical protein